MFLLHVLKLGTMFLATVGITSKANDHSPHDNFNDDNISNYTGAQVIQVKLLGDTDLSFINTLARSKEISIWNLSPRIADILVWHKSKREVKRLLRSRTLYYTIIISDVQAMIDDAQAKMDIPNESSLRLVQKMNWERYHNLEDIIAYLNQLSITYANIAKVKVIGKSYEGRELRLFRLSNGKAFNKAVFIEGGIHAREWISIATVTYIINELTTRFGVESDDIRNIDWYFLPIANPDGYHHTHKKGGDRLWRKNRSRTTGGCIGVDLNRNFGYKWGTKGRTSRDHCNEEFAGSHAFSEAETEAIREFLMNSSINFSAYVAFHNYGQLIVYPYGYTGIEIYNHQELQNTANRMAKLGYSTSGYKYKVGTIAKLLYPVSGVSIDWTASIGINHSYIIELSDTGTNGFLLPSKYIIKVANSSLSAIRELAASLNNK